MKFQKNKTIMNLELKYIIMKFQKLYKASNHNTLDH
jgi:hypothetical protein